MTKGKGDQTARIVAGRPLLRPPPFPALGGDPLSDPADMPAEETRLAALLERIGQARVGGAFWAESFVDKGKSRIVVLRDPQDEAAASRSPTDLADAQIVRAEIDPWSIVASGRTVHARTHDEIALVCLIAGSPFVPLSGEDDRACHLAKALFGRAFRSPFTGKVIAIEEMIDLLALWRREIDFNRGVAGVSGMAFWKREAVDRFLWVPGRDPAPAVKPRDVANIDGAVVAWPSRMPEGLAAAAQARAVPLIAMEDGFIRSVGLGSNCHAPLSIVLDAQGIYFDATRPSDLETILETHPFPPALLDRARKLAGRIVAANITKYGVGSAVFDPHAPAGKRIVLVCGQVEDDLSVRLGGGGVAGNLDLIRRARAVEPDAHILFKPHPDVDAGHRKGRIEDRDALRHVDAVVRGVPMPALFDAVDAVHVLTSLAGFEALLRGIPVVTHGLPFYAGWGLTRDLAGPIARRTRRLGLDALVAGALILYPRYLDPETGLTCPPEVLVDRFADRAMPRETWVTRARLLQSRLRTAFRPKGRAA